MIDSFQRGVARISHSVVVRLRWVAAVLAKDGRRGQGGQALVETAVILPLFFLLLFGVFEFAMALTGYLSATYAARSAARYASLHSLTSSQPATTASITAVVKSQMFLPGISTDTVAVAYANRPGGSGTIGNYVGQQVGVGVSWSQNIGLPNYGKKAFSVSSQAYRVITR